MAVPDISGLSKQELHDLIQAATAAYRAAETAELGEVETRRKAVADAIAALTALLGPENAPPSITSIRGVLAHSDATITQNAALAHRLMLQGLEAAVAALLDVAHVVAAQNR